MKTENDLGLTPEETPTGTPEDAAGLFTDQAGGDGAAMLPGSYDGAPGSAATPEAIETKTGEKLLRLKLPNGHVYTGKTERDLLEQVFKGKVAADQAILDREMQIRTLQAAPPQAPQAPRQPMAGGAPALAPGEAWDPQKYLNLLGEDPMKARMYQDQFMYGGIDPVQATTYSYQVAQRLEQNMIAASFHDRNPDFPISPENSSKLLGVLQARGLPPNLVNLEWGFGELKRNGQLSPAGPGPAGAGDDQFEDITFGQSAPPATVAGPPAAPAKPIEQRAGPQRRGGGAPPSPRNGGGNGTPDVVSFENMTLEQLKEHARKVGVLKH